MILVFKGNNVDILFDPAFLHLIIISEPGDERLGERRVIAQIGIQLPIPYEQRFAAVTSCLLGKIPGADFQVFKGIVDHFRVLLGGFIPGSAGVVDKY